MFIDAEEAHPYIGLTESRIGFWESFGKRLFAVSLGGGGILPFAWAIKLCRKVDRADSSIPAPKRLVGAPWTSQSRIFQDLRADGHDRKQGSTGGNPPSGHEKPELSCLFLFTPRNYTHQKKPSGDEIYMENQSWKCAFN
jgi:hypothetical protein